jgi:hypothetical protein
VIIVNEYEKPQAQRGKALFFMLFGGGNISLTANRNKTVTKLLDPAITMGCQSINLMNKPLVLHKNAATRIDNCPANLCSFRSFRLITKQQ